MEENKSSNEHCSNMESRGNEEGKVVDKSKKGEDEQVSQESSTYKEHRSGERDESGKNENEHLKNDEKRENLGGMLESEIKNREDKKVAEEKSIIMETEKIQPEIEGEQDQLKYEWIDGAYHYTHPTTNRSYRYDSEAETWVEVSLETEGHQSVDSEGRTYYNEGGAQMCKDKEGNIYKYSETGDWVFVSSSGCGTDTSKNEDSKWYFYEGENTFYRDHSTDIVYRLNKDKNEWELYEGKLKGKRPRVANDDEEFDTSDEEEFDENGGKAPPGHLTDPNIHYDGSMYTKRDPHDNTIYEWDVNRRAWFPKLDEDFMASYQMSYGFNPDGTKNENPVKYDDDEDDEEPPEDEEIKNKSKKMPTKKPAAWFEMDETQSTKVYVSNLPEDLTEEAFIDVMSKCGLVLRDVETNKYKIKLYKDKEGNFKGDALCSYIKIESVTLALQILDGYDVGGKKIKVERAKFTLKGDYNPSLKPRKRKKKDLEKLKKKQEKLFDWRPDPVRGQRMKHENQVIIANVFDPKEFENKMEKILVHKEAIRAQCVSFGEIKKLEIYDLHPDGVIQVAFRDVEAADLCVATLNKRLYSGRILKVATWDGKQRFRVEETEEQKAERLEKWNKFLDTTKKET
ncbi:RRM1_TatSF1_like and RRM2_TatSF1_like domain-containing protein barc [Oratosquilla oratoria]|uniref:RRM1_TatSF1_like and RRM2_TatSF1_like domain-containing protein barc n=1 Tax=Oratosquilla oratoria TaxID=337810 RepID=UPI003F767DE7